MLRTTFLLLLLLSGLSAAANPASEAKKPEGAQTAATPAEEIPIFEVGNQGKFRNWLLPRMTFDEKNFSEGDCAFVFLTFTLDKKGRMSKLAILKSTNDHLANKVLAEASKATRWMPKLKDEKPVESSNLVSMSVLLERGADGALYAVDNTIYSKTDEQPMFMGQGAGFFRTWVQEQVESQLGVDTTRKSVLVNFVIERDGAASNLKISKAEDPAVPRAIVAAMARAPRFTPGMVAGKTVRSKSSIKIRFKPAPASEKSGAGGDGLDDAFAAAEVMPTFKGGGLESFRQWVNQNLKYPAEALENGSQGRVVASFIIERDGSLSSVAILQSPDELLSQAVRNLLADSPKWTPGRQDGKIVRVSYVLPVEFRAPIESRSSFLPSNSPNSPPFDFR